MSSTKSGVSSKAEKTDVVVGLTKSEKDKKASPKKDKKEKEPPKPKEE